VSDLLWRSCLFYRCSIYLSVEVDIVLEPSDQRLEFFGFLLKSHVGFPNTLIKCSVKYL
jgi:hypothetical protein